MCIGASAGHHPSRPLTTLSDTRDCAALYREWPRNTPAASPIPVVRANPAVSAPNPISSATPELNCHPKPAGKTFEIMISPVYAHRPAVVTVGGAAAVAPVLQGSRRNTRGGWGEGACEKDDEMHCRLADALVLQQLYRYSIPIQFWKKKTKNQKPKTT